MLNLNAISFLAATTSEKGADEITKDIVGSAYDTFIGIVNVVFPAIIGILLALAIILGIKVGIAYAKAEDDEGKKKAKSQLINLLTGFIVAIVISAVIMIILKNSSSIRDLFKVTTNSSEVLG